MLNQDSFRLILTCIFVITFFQIKHDQHSFSHTLLTYLAMSLTWLFEHLKLTFVLSFVLEQSFLTFILTFLVVLRQMIRMLHSLNFKSFDVVVELI